LKNPLLRALSHLKPYWKTAFLSIFMLSISVVIQLQIPKLIQKIVDEGIRNKDLGLIGITALMMIVLALLDAGLSIGNTFLSVGVVS